METKSNYTHTMEKHPDIKVEKNRIGWWAIADKRGGWVGDEDGVTCYEDHEIAKVANTIIWQMSGGGRMDFEIKRFTGAVRIDGDYDFKKNGEQALIDYERRARRVK
jgi:hypothetical protein